MNLYSDSIVDEPHQMLNPNEAQGSEDKDQQKFGPGQIISSSHDWQAHRSCSPYIDEFSELIRKVSTDVLKHTLMTHRQRLFAEALWEAQNYGGSESKCVKRLQELTEASGDP